jgi:hypothetical protein
MNLLDQIAAISDEAFIAWELLVDSHPTILTDVPPIDSTYADDDWHLYWAHLDGRDEERPFLCRGGRILAVWVPESGDWIRRLPSEDDYVDMESRARAAITRARSVK